METLTGRVPEPKKMRVSFLVLAGVIAVCNTNASAKAVASATDDETNGVSRREQNPQKDTAYEAAVRESNIHDGEHILSKRYADPDSNKRRSVLRKKKKDKKKKKTESKKFESSKKFEEHKSKSVSNKTTSRRTQKRGIQSKNRQAFVGQGIYVPPSNARTVSFPVIFRDRNRHRAPWSLQANIEANMIDPDYKNKVLPARELRQVQELADVFHTALRGALESLFRVLAKELRKKIEKVSAGPVMDGNMRSSCTDSDDGSCDSGLDAVGAVALCRCMDDNPVAGNEPDDEDGPSDAGKRSEESPLEYLQQTLPAVVRAAETILAESVEYTEPSDGGDGNAGDDVRSEGDEPVEPAPDYGINNRNQWGDEDTYMDHGPAA